MTDTVALPTDLAAPVDGPPLAAWSRRVVAALLDGAILSGATWLVLGSRGVVPWLQPGFGDFAPDVAEPVGWHTSGVLVALVLGMLALQGWTGATPGKRVAGVAVVRRSDGRPAGIFASGLRVVAHLLDSILLIGYLRPLWNARRQTFADSIAGTLVVQTREPPAHPWFARYRREPSAVGSTAVSVAAVSVCVLGVGFSMSSSSSWGGEWESPVPCVDDGTVAAPTATATASRAGGTMLERRLWIVRETDDHVEKGLRITWTWTSPAATLDGALIETDLRRADGSVIEVTQDATTSMGSPDMVLDPLLLSTSDLGEAGPGWTAQNRLVVNGEVIGACSIDAADWEAADQPDYGPPWTD